MLLVSPLPLQKYKSLLLTGGINTTLCIQSLCASVLCSLCKYFSYSLFLYDEISNKDTEKGKGQRSRAALGIQNPYNELPSMKQFPFPSIHIAFEYVQAAMAGDIVC